METTANILVNGVKQKMYQNNIVYLSNNTEFEIEFFNKSKFTVCPSITINGEKLKSSPVIYNGQKYILSDFIDINKRFLFKTYKVDSNNSDVQDAIKYNGIITIEYFYEKVMKKVDDSDYYDDIRFRMISNDETETGKIMKGSDSNVKYNNVNIELDYTFSEKLTIKLLPISQKPEHMKCEQCGAIQKSDSNYCSNCGRQLIL